MIADGESLLRAIADRSYVEALMLVEAGVCLNDPIDDGASPLFAAILSGHLPLIEAMLRRGADVNFRAREPANTTYADTPLDLAMQARVVVDWDAFHPVVKLLLSKAAKDADDHGGDLPNLGEIEARAKAWQARAVDKAEGAEGTR